MSSHGAYEPSLPTVAFAGDGATSQQTASTSLNITAPANVADGDMLLAIVMGRAVITPPAGWTLQKSISFSSTTFGTTQYLNAYTKDTVTSADSSGTWSWSQAASARFIGQICRITSDMGSPIIYTDEDATFSNTAQGLQIPIAAITADRGTEIAIMAASTIASASSSVNALAGATLWRDSGIQRFNVWWGAYDDGESTPTALDAESTDPANNGCGCFTLMIRGSQFEQYETLNTNISQSSTEDTTYNVALSEDIDMWEHPLYGTLFEAALADSTTVTDVLSYVFAYGVTMSEGVDLTPGTTPFTRFGLALADSVDVSSVLSAFWGIAHTETIRVTAADAPTMTFNLALAQAMSVAEAITAGRGVTVAETVQMSEVLAFLIGVRVLDRLGLTETILPGHHFNVTLSQAVQFTDVISRFFGMSASDTVDMSFTLSNTMRTNPALADTATITDTHSATLVLRLALADTVNVTPTEALKMTLTGALADTVEIGAAYLGPDGSITTWAVNTRNAAVTEYSNYDFNSFARMGHKYLGANSTGLYELNGDDDDGASIIAKLKGGQLQVAGSRFSSFAAAYIGIHGPSGNVILRLESGGGQTYTYTVKAKDDRTTRVRFGKGLRARYFVYELETTGQDFDLDTIEFLPIKANRRD